MQKKKLKIEYRSLDELRPYEKNAKLHPDEQVEQIMESIRQFGMNDPIAVWRDGTIIEGHGRLLACQKLGIEQVPVVDLSDLTDEERRAYTLAHNKLTMNSGFDFAILEEELAEIGEIDMEAFGFDMGFLEPPEAVSEDEYEEPDDLPARVQPGDVWVLEAHRLICGDATQSEILKKLMGG